MYLNLIQISESFGVSEQVVSEWVRKEGMPHVHDRGRILFEQSQVMDWATQRGLTTHTGFLCEPAPSLANTFELGPLLRRGGIWRNVFPSEVAATFERIVSSLRGLTEPVRNLLVQRLGAPDGVIISPVGGGFALPHPTMRIALGETSAVVALIQLNAPYPEIKTPDGLPITRMLFFVSPSPRVHVTMLGLLARSITSGDLTRALDNNLSDEDIFRAISPQNTPTPGKGSRR